MKKILCLLMAAVLVVVMMAPMEARAASVPSMSVPSVSGVLIAGGTDAEGSNSGNLVYEFVIPVKVGPKGNYGQYINGTYQFDLQPTIVFDDRLNSDYSLSGVRWSVIDYYSHTDGVTCTPGTNNSNNGVKYNVTSDYQLSNMTVICNYFDVAYQSVVVSDVVYVVYRVSLDIRMLDTANFAVPVLYMYPSVSERADDRVVYNDMQQNQDIVDSINALVSNISGYFQQQWNNIQIWVNELRSDITGFKDQIGSWFQTQWTNGRQWTDELIDAIVGQGGGSDTINSAQDKLDQQLNDFEAAEGAIADQVVDKVEIPTLSLSNSQASALSWVIGMINTWYIEFSELQILFGSIMFFGIIGVVLFGRRSL